MAHVWPGFARKSAPNNNLRAGDETTGNEKWLSGGPIPDFEVTAETINDEARLAAKLWIRHPAYKMTLASSQKGADADGDGVIDQQEFRDLLAQSGYKGTNVNNIFAEIDADGDGKLTEAEIKLLSQGKATLQSGKVR